MRRAISIALCLLMVLSLFTIIPVDVSAIERSLTATGVISGGNCGVNGDNVTWSFDSSTGILTISGSGDMADYEYYSNPAPWNSYGITGVIIEDGVTSIGLHAFRYCTSLAEVSIPDSVVEIGRAAFSECSSLTSIVLPASLESISNGLFDSCSNLTQIEIPASLKSIGYSAFSMCSSLESIELPDSLESLGDEAFIDCTSLSYINIPNKINSIGSKTFKSCTSLTYATIPASVTSIGFWAFYDCTSLTHISVPDSVTSIGNQAFGYDSYGAIIDGFTIYGLSGSTAENYANDNELTFVDSSDTADYTYTVENGEATVTGYNGSDTILNIPAVIDGYTVTKIGRQAFRNKNEIDYVVVPDTVRIIDNDAFYRMSDLISVTLGSNITSIGENAFYECTSLSSVNLPDTLAYLGRYAFFCTALTEIEVPKSLTSVGYSRYGWNWEASYSGPFTDSKIKTVSFEQGTVRIPDGLFTQCDCIESVTIPSTVTEIGDLAFYRCYNLETINFPDGIETIGDGAFTFCRSLKNVILPENLKTLGAVAFGATALESIEIPKSLTTISYDYNGILAIDQRWIHYAPFAGCNNLKTVTFETGTETVLNFLLSYCSGIEEMVIPAEITEIGQRAFYMCTNLRTVSFAGNSVTNIVGSAFFGCSSLNSIDLPNGLQSIGSQVFFGTDMESVVIPDSVTSIGYQAIGYYYDNGDKTVTDFIIYGYTGSAAETYANNKGFEFVPLPAVGVHSLTLNGDIGVNFYMQLTEKEITEGAAVNFSWIVDGKEKTESVTLTAADKTANGYKATCHVAPAEMTSEITATLQINGIAVLSDTYSVQSYAQTILTDNDFRTKYIAAEGQAKYDALIELVQAMLDYGARSQIKFIIDKDNPVNGGVYTFTAPVDPDGITATMSDMNTDLSSYGLEYTGSTVVLLTKTSIRHYYKIVRSDLFNAVKNNITFNGKKVGYTVKGDEIYFELKNISAPDLNMPYTLHIGTTNYQYAVLDYIKNYLTNGTNNDTKALISAMYYYHQKAKAFFG